MPGFDGTGPRGAGSMTGKGLGPCGRGFRRGYSRGFGYRYWQSNAFEPVVFNKEDEKKILEAELKEVEAEKQAIEKRLKELD